MSPVTRGRRANRGSAMLELALIFIVFFSLLAALLVLAGAEWSARAPAQDREVVSQT